jgi:hypothetical protein
VVPNIDVFGAWMKTGVFGEGNSAVVVNGDVSEKFGNKSKFCEYDTQPGALANGRGKHHIFGLHA